MVSPLLTLENKIKWCMLKEGLHLYHWANQLIKVIWRNSKPTERKLVGTLELMNVLHEYSPEHFLPYLLIPSMIVLHENSPEQRWAHVPVGFRVPRARVPRFFLRVPRSCTTCISRYPALLRSRVPGFAFPCSRAPAFPGSCVPGILGTRRAGTQILYRNAGTRNAKE